MRVVICGAGLVGYSIASYLSREDNDVTVIDHDPARIAKINTDLDVRAILGHSCKPDTLVLAEAQNADIIIAVTQIDEVNMIACQVAHSLFGVPKKIARIRDQSYLDPKWANLFSRAHMPIDFIISPEVEVANAISMRLSIPGTTSVIPMADGKVHLCGVICENTCPIVNTPLRQLTSLFPNVTVEIIGIFRGGEFIVPTADDEMQYGDEVYFIADSEHLDRVLSGFGHHEQTARNVIVMGGGNIGLNLIKTLKNKHKDIYLKIIESDPEKAKKLGSDLKGTTVLQGNGLSRGILSEANIANTEAFVAVTNDDETNILGSLLAKEFGCERAITLVNKTIYDPLMANLGLGAIVSPRAITVSTIMQYVRRGRIRSIHNIRDGYAEVMEIEVSESCSVLNLAIRDIPFPVDVLVGAIIRGDKVVAPFPDTVIRNEDILIIMAKSGQAKKVEKMFSVQVDLF